MRVHSQLRYLDVAGCVALTQRGFAELTGGLAELCVFKMGGCSRMATTNDACLAAVAALTSLAVLDLAGCIDITDTGEGCSACSLEASTTSNCPSSAMQECRLCAFSSCTVTIPSLAV